MTTPTPPDMHQALLEELEGMNGVPYKPGPRKSKALFADCYGCPLEHAQVVQSSGPASCEYALCGEGPGYVEVRQGEFWTGPSGEMARGAAARAGYNVDTLLLTNATLCDPSSLGPDKDVYLPNAVRRCRPRLIHELKTRGVHFVLAAGRFAVSAFDAADRISVTTDHGKRFQADPAFDDVEVMPLVHPAAILHRLKEAATTKRLKPTDIGAQFIDLVSDMRRFRQDKLKLPSSAHEVLTTVEAALERIEMTRRRVWENTNICALPTLLTIDLETDGLDPLTDRILCLGFTITPDFTYIIPENILYDGHMVVALNRLFKQDGVRLAAHNAKFETKFVTLARHLGADIRFVEDTMVFAWALDERLGTHGLKALVAKEWETEDYSLPVDRAFEAAKVEHAAKVMQLKADVKLYSKVPKKEDEATRIKREHLLSRARASLAIWENHTPSYRDIDTDILYPYLALDVQFTHALVPMLRERVASTSEKLEQLCDELYIPIQGLAARMENDGFLVDTTYQHYLGGDPDAKEPENQGALGKLANAAKEIVLKATEVDGESIIKNPGSTQQVSKYLFEHLGIRPVKMTKGGNAAADEQVLKAIQRVRVDRRMGRDPVIDNVLAYRKAIKLRSTYVYGKDVVLGPDGKVHLQIHTTGTNTGRPSFSSPNLGNLPRPKEDPNAPNIRKMYVAPPGHKVLVCDYSQAEVRMLAWLSDDKFLVDAFRAGEDVHDLVTAFIFGEDWRTAPDKKAKRTIGKTANLSGLYNLFEPYPIVALLEKYDILVPLADLTTYMRRYKERVPGLVDYMERVKAQILSKGYVELIFGNRRRFGYVNRDNLLEATKEGINATAQGPSCQLTWYAMLEIERQQRAGNLPMFSMPLMVYDSIVSIVPDKHVELVAREVNAIMNNMAYAKLGDKVPFEVDAKWAQSLGEAG